MELKIEYINIKDLKPYRKNTRKHTDYDIDNIVKSIEKYGFNDAVGIWSKDNIIVEGHGRVLAAEKLGMKEVPCVRLDHLTDEERREYSIIHNKSAELSSWDFDVLSEELQDLDMSDWDVDWGFDEEEQEIEVIEDDFDVDEEIPDEPKSKLGEIYKLGNHYLMCGDSTNEEDVKKLMNGAKADMIFTDPPYNVDYTDGFKKERKILNDHFSSDKEAGELLWLPVFKNMRSVANDCCPYYVCMPQGGTHMMMMMMAEAGWQVKHEIIWEKQSIVLNRADYNYQHEPLLYGWNKTHQFYGKGKYHTTSIWKYDRPTKSKEHPTMKPIELICEALQNSSKKNDVILDLFGGSGSTLIACEQLNRKCYMMELDTHYVDVIIARWEKLTGNKSELIKE